MFNTFLSSATNQRKYFILTFLGIGIGIVISIIFIETLGRIILFDAQRLIAGRQIPDLNQMVRSEAFVPDSVLGYLPNPEWLKKILSSPFRNGVRAEINEEPSKDKTIAVLGDSLLTEGYLARAISERLGSSHFVYSLGVPSYNTVQEVYFYEHFVKLRPDSLVLSFCLNDFFTSFGIVNSDIKGKREMRQRIFEPIHVATPWLYQNSVFYRLFITYLIRHKFKSESGDTPDNILSMAPLIETSLQKLKAFTKSTGTKLVVVVYPILTPRNAPWQWESISHTTILEILKRNNIPFIDLSAELRAIPEKFRKSPGDFVHPSLEGHRIAAEKLFQGELGLYLK